MGPPESNINLKNGFGEIKFCALKAKFGLANQQGFVVQLPKWPHIGIPLGRRRKFDSHVLWFWRLDSGEGEAKSEDNESLLCRRKDCWEGFRLTL